MRNGRSTPVETYEQRLNGVIDYIEANFDGNLPLERLSDVACFSPFHFHRLFRAYVGETPHVFVRRLRLQKALLVMERRPHKNLAEVALECGFSQSSDFSRAFREVYGYPPSKHTKGRQSEDSKIRQDTAPESGYGFGRPQPAVEGDDFQVRIEELPAQRIAYVRVIGAQQPDKLIAALGRLLNWGREMGIYPGATLASTSPDNPEIVPASRYRLDLCMILPKGMRETGRISFAGMPALRYAMVHSRGDIHKVERAWAHLFGKWLPSSGYEPFDAPYLELFRDSDDSKGWSTLDLDCCVPIRPISY